MLETNQFVEWRKTSVFTNEYMVSNDGRVYSVRRQKELCPSTDKDGYLYYVLSVDGNKRTIKAHRLVATAFLDNPDGKPTIDHVNGNVKDNRVCNLRWATHREQWENPISRERHAESAQKYGERLNGIAHTEQMKPVIAYGADGETYVFQSVTEAGRTLGINPGNISAFASGRKKNAIKGYKFSYIEKNAVAVAKYHFPEDE